MWWGLGPGRSPLLLAELALGTQGGQDGRAGMQAVALTAALKLLDSGQDLPLLKRWLLRLHLIPSPPLGTPCLPTLLPTHLPPLLKIDEVPLGAKLV